MPPTPNKSSGSFSWADLVLTLLAIAASVGTNRQLADPERLSRLAQTSAVLPDIKQLEEAVSQRERMVLQISDLPAALERNRRALEHAAMQPDRIAEQLQSGQVYQQHRRLIEQHVRQYQVFAGRVAPPEARPAQWMALARDGIPVVWVVPDEPLDWLRGTTTWVEPAEVLWAERTRVLLADEEAVLVLLERRLTECVHPGLQVTVGEAWEAVRAYQRGSYGPAQSHAANVTDSVGWRYQLLRRCARLSGNASPANWQDRAVLAAFLHAWRRWERGDPPVLDGYSRHATAHEPRPEHCGRGTDLVALMVMVSVLRQIQQWHERGSHP